MKGTVNFIGQRNQKQVEYGACSCGENPSLYANCCPHKFFMRQNHLHTSSEQTKYTPTEN
jgi:hypothetical protein